ncbi:MAG TPA: hypothetical protein HA306_03810, partial [Methanosarcina sp.]|nr:hypothetical protein [Methanosarcina sp.]
MNLKGVVGKETGKGANNKDENKKPEKEAVKVGPLLAELGHAPGTIKMT